MGDAIISGKFHYSHESSHKLRIIHRKFDEEGNPKQRYTALVRVTVDALDDEDARELFGMMAEAVTDDAAGVYTGVRAYPLLRSIERK